jgi:uncharacterized alpha-E superfamily protein
MKENMLSRVAEGMYWLNRYMERTHGILLTLNTYYILSFDNDIDDSLGYKPLLQYYTDLSEEQINTVKFDTTFVVKYIIYDNENENSVKTHITRARENARGSQDRITKELWEHINSLYHYIHKDTLLASIENSQELKIITKLNKEFLLYNGILQVTMPRGLGWNFSNIGKLTERCLQTIFLTYAYFKPIQFDLDGPQDLLYWRRLLLSLSGYELYLKSYSNISHNRKVVDQVIFKRDFSHSVFYTLNEIDSYLQKLLIDNNLKEAKVLYNQFGRLKSRIEFTDYQSLTNEQLEELLISTKEQLEKFSVDFSKLFFSYD